jgi:hypothetical protein
MTTTTTSLSLDQEVGFISHSINTKHWIQRTSLFERKYTYRAYSRELLDLVREFKSSKKMSLIDDIPRFAKVLPHLKPYPMYNGSVFRPITKTIILPPVLTTIESSIFYVKIPQNHCNCDKDGINNTNTFRGSSEYLAFMWNEFHMCAIREFRIVWALAIDYDASDILFEITHWYLETNCVPTLYILREIYAPACQLIFPHLSQEENKMNQLKRFTALVQKIIYHPCNIYDTNSIVFSVVNDLGYDLCKDVLIRYLFPDLKWSRYNQLFDMSRTFDKFNSGLHLKRHHLIDMVAYKHNRFGIRCFIENFIETGEHTFESFKKMLPDHEANIMIRQGIVSNMKSFRKKRHRINQCFMLYSTLPKTHKIIQMKVLAQLQFKDVREKEIDSQMKYFDPNLISIIASFLSVVKYINPHQIKRKRDTDEGGHIDENDLQETNKIKKTKINE